ncbi:ArsR family transcriptional regulator [Halonotius aquaticus]|uniref:ArsR family transcriptional regulator n=1 Tax=Halonotius aquaticus TaxID=2216978 RepID=A0A3A6PTG8_9EURY|nr:helix-turn-helix domain-containing protein [Halonotius aquaticus]RJX42799.1 ArsR family transcriptional regulator [Halonotius aquaticus]
MADFIERLQQRSSAPTQQPRIMEMEDEGADEVLSALSPTTRRRVYRALFTEPQTTSELAESVDTSIQNVQYHLETLQDAGLVEPVETVYSGKGNEMTVFAPASDPLVFVGDADRLPAIKESLHHVVGGLAVLGVASLLVQWLVAREFAVRPQAREATTMTATEDAAMEAAAEASTDPTLQWLIIEVLEPGLVFFVGGLVVAALVVWFRRA